MVIKQRLNLKALNLWEVYMLYLKSKIYKTITLKNKFIYEYFCGRLLSKTNQQQEKLIENDDSSFYRKMTSARLIKVNLQQLFILHNTKSRDL